MSVTLAVSGSDLTVSGSLSLWDTVDFVTSGTDLGGISAWLHIADGARPLSYRKQRVVVPVELTVADGNGSASVELNTALLLSLFRNSEETASLWIGIWDNTSEKWIASGPVDIAWAPQPHGTVPVAVVESYALAGEAQDLVDAHDADDEAHAALFAETVSRATANGQALADANRFEVGQFIGAAWVFCVKTGTQLKAWLKTYFDGLYATLVHADRHAAAGADPVTLAAIQAQLDAALPPTYGADNKLATMADIPEGGGGAAVTVEHISAASFTPTSGKHYVCANDVEVLAPAAPLGTELWESSITLEAGAMLSYPVGWRVGGFADPDGGNRCRIAYANGANWYLDWEAAYTQTSGSIVYVSTAGNDANDGFSWALAKRTPAAAFLVVPAGGQVWIATGTYNAATVVGFVLPENVTVYGGFAGTEATVAERSRTPDGDGIGAAIFGNPTVLTNTLDVTPGALYVIFAATGTGGTPATLDGLTIGPGKIGVHCAAAGACSLVDCLVTGCVNAGSTSNGGGLYGATATACTIQSCSAGRYGGGAYSCTCTNCAFTGNSASYGGGAYSCTCTNCAFTGNSASDAGGGAYSGTCTNCAFTGNSASNAGGGASSCTCTNCAFTGNSVSNAGGGASSCTCTNCAFTGNSAPNGGGAYSCTCTNCAFTGNSASNAGGGASSCTCTNCLLVRNTTGATNNGHAAYGCTLVNCALLHNGGTGTALTAAMTAQRSCLYWRNTGTINGTDTTPIADASLGLASFAAPLDIAAGLPTGDDIALLDAAVVAHGYDHAAGSAAIDAGTNSYNTTTLDIRNRTRIVNTTIDCGAYEYQG